MRSKQEIFVSKNKKVFFSCRLVAAKKRLVNFLFFTFSKKTPTLVMPSFALDSSSTISFFSILTRFLSSATAKLVPLKKKLKTLVMGNQQKRLLIIRMFSLK